MGSRLFQASEQEIGKVAGEFCRRHKLILETPSGVESHHHPALVKLCLLTQPTPTGISVKADLRLVSWFRLLFLAASVGLVLLFLLSLVGVPTSNNVWRFLLVFFFLCIQGIGGVGVESECEEQSEEFWSALSNRHHQVQVADAANHEWLARYFAFVFLPGLAVILFLVAAIYAWSSISVALLALVLPFAILNLLEATREGNPFSLFKSKLAIPFVAFSVIGPLTLFSLGLIDRVFRMDSIQDSGIESTAFFTSQSAGLGTWWEHLLQPVTLPQGEGSLPATYAGTIGSGAGLLSLPGLVLLLFFGLLFAVLEISWWRGLLGTGPRWRELWGSRELKFGELTEAASRREIVSRYRTVFIGALWFLFLCGWLMLMLTIMAVFLPSQRMPNFLLSIGFVRDSVSGAAWIRAASASDFGSQNWIGPFLLLGLLLPALYLMAASVIATVSRFIGPLVVAISDQNSDRELRELARETAAELGTPEPLIVEASDPMGVYSTQLLPFGRAMIVFPLELVPLLTAGEKRALLLHEFHHVRNDLKTVSWLTALSAVVPLGSALLALNINFAEREYKADHFALNHMGADSALRSALQVSEKYSSLAEIKRAAKQPTYLARLIARLINSRGMRRYREVHSFVFGEQLIGYVHPTMAERVENLERAQLYGRSD